MPVLRAMALDFTPLAYIDSCTSIQWTRKLWEIGGFEIHVSLSAEGANSVAEDTIVFYRRAQGGDCHEPGDGKK